MPSRRFACTCFVASCAALLGNVPPASLAPGALSPAAWPGAELATYSTLQNTFHAPLRPPAELRAVTPADLPPPLASRLAEADGRVGLLIAVRPADHLDEWDGRDLIRFAAAVRAIELPGGEVVTISAPSAVKASNFP